MEIVIWTLVIMFVATFLVSAFAICIGNRKRKQLRRYWEIEVDMPEDEMLLIMGEGYNRSYLKNNRTKYEWRINSYSYGSYHNGLSVRNYPGVQKVVIYTKNGYVEEIKPYNVR